ncbi:hypothetical protein M9434_001261 [Picochlorum sp. BPE23]|nr:hypothetical protein M9434_001261 [Picochlorum sp. BPE23]
MDYDAGVKKTNGDAQMSKLACVERGYFSDPFVHLFVKPSDAMRARSFPPIINRGYFARHIIIKSLILDYLERNSKGSAKVQVVVLGCGFDTLYFQLRQQGVLQDRVSKYIECDFEDVVAAKRKILEDNQLIDKEDLYCLVGADVRRGEDFMRILKDTCGIREDAPTLFLAECVLVYMELSFSNALLRQVSHSFPESLCIVYEQVNPNDAFGKQMMINLSARGCPLKGIVSSLEEQKQRMKCCGWQYVMCEDMLSLFNRGIPCEEIQRINRIEMLDEEEEWKLLLQHYCITCAQNTSDSHSLVDFSLK